MVLSDEDWEALVEILQKEKIIVRTQTGTSKALANELTEEGELFWLKDLGIVMMGESGKKVSELSLYVPVQIFTASNISLDQRVRSFWERLDANTVLGEVSKIILPKAHAIMFESLRPDSFCFLEAEDLEGTDFEGLGWDKSPDARGRFFFTAKNPEDVGKLTPFSMQAHQQKGDTRYPVSQTNQNNLNPQNRNPNMTTYQNGGTAPIKTDPWGGGETRPKNLAVKAVWKIKEFSSHGV